LKMPPRGVTRWAPQSYVRALLDHAVDGSLAGDWWPVTAGW